MDWVFVKETVVAELVMLPDTKGTVRVCVIGSKKNEEFVYNCCDPVAPLEKGIWYDPELLSAVKLIADVELEEPVRVPWKFETILPLVASYVGRFVKIGKLPDVPCVSAKNILPDPPIAMTDADETADVCELETVALSVFVPVL